MSKTSTMFTDILSLSNKRTFAQSTHLIEENESILGFWSSFCNCWILASKAETRAFKSFHSPVRQESAVEEQISVPETHVYVLLTRRW